MCCARGPGTRRMRRWAANWRARPAPVLSALQWRAAHGCGRCRVRASRTKLYLGSCSSGSGGKSLGSGGRRSAKLMSVKFREPGTAAEPSTAGAVASDAAPSSAAAAAAGCGSSASGHASRSPAATAAPQPAASFWATPRSTEAVDDGPPACGERAPLLLPPLQRAWL